VPLLEILSFPEIRWMQVTKGWSGTARAGVKIAPLNVSAHPERKIKYLFKHFETNRISNWDID
jgi:hypothetical protein